MSLRNKLPLGSGSGESITEKVKSSLTGGDSTYPTLQIDEELANELNETLNQLEQGEKDGPLLLVRPPKENESITASTEMLETFHDPRERKIGLGKFSFVTTDAHTHSHEIWYNDGLMQFFLRPATQIDANQFRRQVRKNYPDCQIKDMSQRFLDFEVGDYVSMAKLTLGRDFYFPLKAGLCNGDAIETDPYGGITSDMVVEEDQTKEGERVEAKDSRSMVQTTFESARDVWTTGRPYGIDVKNVSMGLKEGELVGNMIQDFELKNPSARKKETAKMLNEMRGAKGYYMTVRVISVSPYAEIAKRRCYTVAQDYEQFYRSISEQKFVPKPLEPDEIRSELLSAADRTHEYSLKDKIGGGKKIIQPVEALSAVAHLPNDDINTPVIDFAKQDTGPGTPSAGTQIEEEEKRQESDTGERGRKETFNPSGGDKQPPNSSPSVDGTSADGVKEVDFTEGDKREATSDASEPDDEPGVGPSIDDFDSDGSDSRKTPPQSNTDGNIDESPPEEPTSDKVDDDVEGTEERVDNNEGVNTPSPTAGDSLPEFSSASESDEEFVTSDGGKTQESQSDDDDDTAAGWTDESQDELWEDYNSEQDKEDTSNDDEEPESEWETDGR